MASMTKTAKTVKATPAPATGTVKWLEKFDGRFGWLRITSNTQTGPVTADYELAAVFNQTTGRVAGFRLFGEGKMYEIDPDTGTCTCPIAVMQHRGKPHACKHSRGVRSALARLFQPVTLNECKIAEQPL